MNCITYSSPLGELYIIEEDGMLTHLYLNEEDYKASRQESLAVMEETPLLKEAAVQLEEYFQGKRKVFSLPIKQNGTPFQQSVWAALQEIPYGTAKNYGQIAEEVGSPKAVRAIGQANRRNSLPIIVPCHRVIGKNQSLTGYAGSRTNLKELLLNLENISYSP
ncbi:methylated-DNA--[protein]-cysteine S-methyltransferase [Bacillus lacus]|uniref:Methylated-DNA--protein-cysteine methyltransferase n=1 Tax=Metabacillus lacus TaxID=1983721 RepID=A0A7X2J0X4_9BACI|nr:methylated-DNA--[protein]-cysteine S-methyltransferase [Metabacillus lacus]MRX73301.1 methylated-DNA--[protein]-cysteine S-methyltransferase [Metabacillus lacus]